MIDHTFKGGSVRKLSVAVLILLLGFLGFQANIYGTTTAGNVLTLESPDGKAKIKCSIDPEGRPLYSLSYKGEPILDPSALGFEFMDEPAMAKGFRLVKIERSSYDERWETVVGQNKLIHNQGRELALHLRESSQHPRDLILRFRAANDGIAFRYEFPKQSHLQRFSITSELTEFNFSDDFSAWWIEGSFDSYERIFEESPISTVRDANTPLTMKTSKGSYLSIHEAHLVDYADMTLVRKQNRSFKAGLAPWPDGITKVKGAAPMTTPWRVILLGESAGDLVESDLILNLNPPCALEDPSWVEPAKYGGIWWSVHLGYETFQVGPHHAATTEKAKRMIDHYRELGVPAMLVEGWNEGWEYRNKREDIPHFSQAAADYDLEEVVRYGRERGVEVVLHHETMGNIPHYEASLEDSFKMCQRLGIRYIKGGYAGKLKPLGTIKHSQIMVRHYRKLIELAAKYRIMVNIHEPIKMTGWRRTYPNYMTSEGVRGMEFNAWSEGNSPEHGLIIPFTRALAGPMDYNTGIFDLKFDLLKKKGYNWRKERRKGKYPSDPGPCVHTTLAKQLAQYVIFHSPMQMVPDIPENYLGRPEYQFIRDVDVSWTRTKVLQGEIGEFIAIARQGRSTEHWYVGCSTNEQARSLRLNLSFLEEGQAYRAEIYADAKDAHYDLNPTATKISTEKVTRDRDLNLDLAPGGGVAIVFKKL